MSDIRFRHGVEGVRGSILEWRRRIGLPLGLRLLHFGMIAPSPVSPSPKWYGMILYCMLTKSESWQWLGSN